MRGAAEVLYETETTLRLVDHMLGELEDLGLDLARGHGAAASLDEEDDAVVAELPPLRVYREVQEGLRVVQHSRDILQRTAEEKLRTLQGDGDLRRPLSPTDALGSLDTALTLLHRFAEEQADESARAALQRIGDEVRNAAGCLRLYDITEQQLSYAASVLLDTEERLDQISQMLAPAGPEAGDAALFDVGGRASLRMGM